MILVVATHSFLVAIDLDDHGQIVDHKLLNRGYHYGIALVEAEGGSERAQGAKFIVYYGGESVSKQNDRQLLTYRHSGAMEFACTGSTPLDDGIGDVHQIAYANNGLYIVNTGGNSLIYESLDGSVRHEYHLEGRTEDYNHINSIYPYDGHVLLMLHNRGRRESELAALQHDLSRGFTLTRVLSLWHMASHNIYIDDSSNRLLYNGSRDQALVSVDLSADAIEKLVPFEGHSKGLSVTANKVFVGLSEHTIRDRRATARGQLVILERKSLSPLSVVDLNFSTLPHPIGNINEVRCISGGELAHSATGSLNPRLSRLKLARRSTLKHLLSRAQAKLLIPVRKVRGYLR
jgi:hypothetical protein